jgi:hypothetical protein
MGCNSCGKSRQTGGGADEMPGTTGMSYPATGVSLPVAGDSRVPSAMRDGVAGMPVCMHLYGKILPLDRKAVKLYNLLRATDSESAAFYLEINHTLRGWIVQLKKQCPDEELLNNVEELINSEYAKHFQTAASRAPVHH